jgi:HEAT repeat protein
VASFRVFLALLLVCLGLCGDEPPAQSPPPVNKLHILYLVRAGEFDRAFSLYDQYKSALGRHDFEILEQVGLILLEQGSRSSDYQKQLGSIFGCSLAGTALSLDVLEASILSPNPEAQTAAIQCLARFQDDRCEELFGRAMSSDFFFTRIEAAYQLSLRKSHTALGHIESLMYKVPPQMRFFFPQFFALIGTSEAISQLRHMMDDQIAMTRVEAILNAARFGRDDLLSPIRSSATHLDGAEQEACAFALGHFKDSKSLKLLKTLSKSPLIHVKLAALSSLYKMGDESVKEELISQAQHNNLFAIQILGDVVGSEETLLSLAASSDIQVRFNAIVSLLKRQEKTTAALIAPFLIRDSRDLGFSAQSSPGHSLMAWKVIPSAKQHQKREQADLVSLALSVREHLLEQAMALPPASFLSLAEAIFDSRQTDLVPQLVFWIEHMQSEESIALLKRQAQKAGAPLTRVYCTLALFRQTKEPFYKETLLQWIATKKQTEIIRFRPSIPWEARPSDKSGSFDLTPEERSRLLIECYATLVQDHSDASIDILIDAIRSGTPSNHPVLGGLLIQAIQ